jgi:hypothetical protein
MRVNRKISVDGWKMALAFFPCPPTFYGSNVSLLSEGEKTKFA